MVFSDTTSTTRTGLIQDCEDLTGLGVAGISGNATLLGSFTRWINEGYSRVANLIIRADGRMQWDDTNHTDQPISQFSLVNGQQDYNIFAAAPTALQDWLYPERVEILDSAGNGILLQPIDHRDIPIAESEFQETDSLPRWFDFNGTSILLYPAPNYASTNGATIYFKRAPSYFAYDATTKVPGFATLYHTYLSKWASYTFAIAKGLQIANALRNEITLMEKEIGDFYARRPRYEIPVIKRKYAKYK